MPEAPPTPAWENVAIILAVVALWPKLIEQVCAQRWPIADVLLGLALAAMVVVFIRKVRRFRKLWDAPNSR